MKSSKNILMFICVLLLISIDAHASDISAYFSASSKFERLSSQATIQGGMPKITQPEARRLLYTLSDSKRFLSSQTYKVGDLGMLMDMCGTSNRLVMSYTLFGLKESIDPKADPAIVGQQIVRQTANNVIKYQSELEHLQPFMVDCLGKAIPLLTEFALSLKPDEMTPARRKGLQETRMGVIGTYTGMLLSMNAPNLSSSYQKRLLQALADNATQYASVIRPAERERIFQFANAVEEKTPKNLRAYLERIKGVMKVRSCQGLCRF